MTCEIIFGKTNGKIDKTKINAVKAPNGKRSLLYDQLKSITMDDTKALNNYYKTRVDEFTKWYDGELDGNSEPILVGNSYVNKDGSSIEAIKEVVKESKQPVVTREEISFSPSKINSDEFEIKPTDKIIFGHPGIGKTYVFERDNSIIDFDGRYKPLFDEFINNKVGKENRKQYKKDNPQEYQDFIKDMWQVAKDDAKKEDKRIFASDMVLLRLFPQDFDKVITMSKDTFIERSKQRNDYHEVNTNLWKDDLDKLIEEKVDKNKLVTTDKYLSELIDILKKQNNDSYYDVSTITEKLQQYNLNINYLYNPYLKNKNDNASVLQAEIKRLNTLLEETEGYEVSKVLQDIEEAEEDLAEIFEREEQIKNFKIIYKDIYEHPMFESFLLDPITFAPIIAGGIYNNNISFSPTTINLSEFEQAVKDNKYSPAQLNVLKNYKTNTEELTGNTIEVKIADMKELPASIRRELLKKKDTMLLYERKPTADNPRNYVTYRVTTMQDIKFSKNKTEAEVKATEQSDFSKLSREAGTQMHGINERVLAWLVDNKPVVDMAVSKEEFIEQMMDELRVSDLYKKEINEVRQTANGNYIGHSEVYSEEDDDYFTKVDSKLTYEKLAKSMIALYRQAWEVQAEINKFNGTSLRPFFLIEKPFVDKKNDVAGTMDLCVIYSDGTAGIYDHKFVHYKKEKKTAEALGYDFNNPEDKAKFMELRHAQGLSTSDRAENNWVYVADSEFEKQVAWKETSYDGQIGRYAAMLTDLYGVKRIREARILPVVVAYKQHGTGKFDKDGKEIYGAVYNKSKVQFVMTGIDDGIKQIPMSIERTGDPKLDKFLVQLIERKKKLQEEMSTLHKWQDVKYLDKLNNLSTAIQAIQVNRDLMAIVGAANATLNLINRSKEDNSDLSFEQILEMLDEISLYNSFTDLTIDAIKDMKDKAITKDAEDEVKQVELTISMLRTELVKAKDFLINKRLTNLIKYNEKENIMSEEMFNTFRSQTDLNGMSRWLSHLREINHPLFRVFIKALDKVNYNKMMARKKLQTGLEKVMTELNSWAKSKGIKGTDVFKPLIDANGDLISMYDNEKYNNTLNSRAHSYTQKDVDWFKTNFYRSTKKNKNGKSDEDVFQERKQGVFKYYTEKIKEGADNLYKGKTVDELMNAWLDNWDVTHNNGDNSAWKNKALWFGRAGGITANDPNAFYSKDYNNLLQASNKPLLAFYEFYTEQLALLRDLPNVDFKNRIGHNFIANITRDTIDTLAQVGGFDVMKKQWAAIKETMALKDAEDGMMKVGEVKDKEVPVMFIDRIDKDAKSYDLAKSLMVFSDFVNNYNEVKDIEHLSLTLREVLASTGVAKSTPLGGKAMKDGELIVSENGENTNLLRSFDTWMNYYIFGEQDQTTTSDKAKRVVQAVDKARGIVGKKNLALNALSATAGHVNAEFQLNMIATKGNLFDSKTLSKARKETAKALKEGKDKMTDFSSKSVFAFAFFEVSQEDLSMEKANRVSPSSLRRMMAQDKMMFMQRWSDNAIENTILNAMLMSHGIDPNNKRVYPLDVLKERYPKDEFKSLWDSIDMENKNGAGEKEAIMIDQWTGKEIGAETFMSIRNRSRHVSTRVKGNMSDEDIAGYKTHAIGRILGQYRNWIPAMVKERLVGIGKGGEWNATMEEFEIGRWVATWNTFAKGGVKAGASFLKQMIPFMSSKFEFVDTPAMREKYERWIESNPANNPKNPKAAKQDHVSYEQYLKAHIGQTKAMAKELQIYLACLGALYLFMFALGDDEIEENPAWRSIASLMDRTKLELGFFVPVFGYTEQSELVTRSPFAVWQLVSDVTKTLSNTVQESWDIISGTPWDMTSTPSIGDEAWTVEFNERKDNSPLFKYTSEWIPGGKQLANMTGYFGTTKSEDTVWDWINSGDVVK